MKITFKNVWEKLIGEPIPHWGHDEKDTLLIINEPEFKKADKVHDWRNYIPDELRGIWDDLPDVTKLVAYYFAEQQAHNEEWE